MTRTEWYTAAQRQEELAVLLDTSVLTVALDVLRQSNTPSVLRPPYDVTALALQHAVHAGYQKALDDLTRLAMPEIETPRTKPLREWGKKPAPAAADDPTL